MKWFYRIFRTVCVTLIVAAIVVPMSLYVLLTLSPVQDAMCRRAGKELTALLGVNVEVGEMSVAPFNRVTLRDVAVFGEKNDTVMKVRRLGVGVRLSTLGFGRKMVIDYAELTGLDVRISRDSAGSPLNIQPIIEALRPKNKTDRPTAFDLAINTVVIRRSSFSYDVKSEPEVIGRFDSNHVDIDDFRADISLPEMRNNDFVIDVNRIAFSEKSGFEVVDLHGDYVISDSLLSVSDMSLQLKSSKIIFGDISLPLDGLANLKSTIAVTPVRLNLRNGTVANPADFACFEPRLADLDMPVNLDVDIAGTTRRADIDHIDIKIPSREISARISGEIDRLDCRDSLSVNLPVVRLNALGADVTAIVRAVTDLSPGVARAITNAGKVRLRADFAGVMDHGRLKTEVVTDLGDAMVKAVYSRHGNLTNIDMNFETPRFDIAALTGDKRFGNVMLAAGAELAFARKLIKGSGEVKVTEFEFNGYRYGNMQAEAIYDKGDFTASLKINDKNGHVSASADGHVGHDGSTFTGEISVGDLDLYAMHLIKRYEGYRLSGNIEASCSGRSIDESAIGIDARNVAFVSSDNPSLTMNSLTVRADAVGDDPGINLNSDFVDATLTGPYSWKSLVPAVNDIMSQAFPVFFKPSPLLAAGRENRFELHTEVKYSEELNRFLNLPVNLIYPAKIDASLNSSSRSMSLAVDIPYLQQKDKLIEQTSLRFDIDSIQSVARLHASTTMPTANGGNTINIDCLGAADRLDSDLSWQIDRKRLYKGDVSLSTLFMKNVNGDVEFDVSVNPSKLIFNDTAWTVSPARITVMKDNIRINTFAVRRDNQFVTMSGSVSSLPEHVLTLNLLNVNLDYIFESLGIDKAMLGGDASGTFYVSQLFSKEPKMLTPGLTVKNISYNKVVFGDALVRSHWDNATKGITLDATIAQPGGTRSVINGAIYPLTESLDLHFHANKINVAFLKPYMEAFTSDVSGRASGYAHLFGTFKYIDLEGKVLAEDLKLKLDFTNTVYSCNDSVTMTPGRIDIKDVTLHDMFGNTAKLNGVVTHKFFKEPTFDFAITEARDFLSYDVTPSQSPVWYGRIFGNGSAFVKGGPGLVDISVDMSTGPKSTFTFVLSDQEEANEYSFITFRDRKALAMRDSIDSLDPTPLLVRQLRERMKKHEEGDPSTYTMNFQIGINPQATIVLVMDPVGGDKIRANGSGNLKMDYNSASEDLHMYGTYTLDRGSYNFTLQDIIVKDFTISPGSVIKFNGDPYAAQLDIQATYAVKANLSDLDESFLQDKDLNRTNVPVHALMMVSGDIRQPEIKFDLQFPTLTSDTYRKVKSIVSTDDMMNRQIIYLLALNRFYTPDYMGSTTKGNELVSVASSTISSQLGSMLGQLSDNWSIAPNFRSDRGDFSDVEVDLALSSRLLNNRLLFNGNFGYRDKTMNTNQFIGDFDLEYLLNKSGSIRLKAYNRYNDQNYYVKTATTTQGIGIMFKRDFDNIFSFLKKLRRDRLEREKNEAKNDSVVPLDDRKIFMPDETGDHENDFIKIQPKK